MPIKDRLGTAVDWVQLKIIRAYLTKAFGFATASKLQVLASSNQ